MNYHTRYQSHYHPVVQIPDSPSRNLRSRTGFSSPPKAMMINGLNGLNGFNLKSTSPGRTPTKRIYDSPLEEELDLIGKRMRNASPSDNSVFLTEEGAGKFLDSSCATSSKASSSDSNSINSASSSPDKDKGSMFPESNIDFSDLIRYDLAPIPPDASAYFHGLMGQLDIQVKPPTVSCTTPTPISDSKILIENCEYQSSEVTSSSLVEEGEEEIQSSDSDQEEHAVGPPKKKRKEKESNTEKPSSSQDIQIVPSVTPEHDDGCAPSPNTESNTKTEMPMRNNINNLNNDTTNTPEPAPFSAEIWQNTRDGAILELTLKNFMCHRNKHWEFGPHMNCITGENGSGKSAIQAAIMIGCGAKASTTGRAPSLQEVIKTGETSAIVELALANFNGTHSKKKYGDIIRIRKVLAKGSSCTKVQENNGSWENLKKKDLDSLLRPLQIHLKNPEQILTQKASTSFLKEQEPSAMFKSFKEITGIGPAEEFVSISIRNVDETRAILKMQKEIEYHEVERKAQELQAKYDKILEMERFKGICANLLREYGWAVVIRIENGLADLETKIGALNKQLKEDTTKKEQLSEKKSELVRSHEVGKKMLGTLQKEVKILDSKYEKAHEAVRESTKENKTIAGRIKLLQDGKQKLEREILELDRQMKETLSNQRDDDERVKLQTEQEIAGYQATIDATSQEILQLKVKKIELEKQANTATNQEDAIKSELREFQALLKDKIREEKEEKDAEFARYDKYGEQIKLLVSRIKRAKWVGEPPVGPIGAWITVKPEYEKYIPAVEQALGRTLRTFVACTSEDVDPLRNMIHSIFGKQNPKTPGIIGLESYGNKREDGYWKKGKAVFTNGVKFPTLLDLLDFEHLKVQEALVERENIERVIVFKTEIEACSIMKNRHKVPKTCYYGLSMDCFRFKPDPAYQVNPLPQKRPPFTIQPTKTRNDKEALQAEIQELTVEIAKITEKWEAAKTFANGFQRQLAELDALIRQKSQELNRAKSLMRTCEQTLINLANLPDLASHTDFMEDRKTLLESTLGQRNTELKIEVDAKNESDKRLSAREAEAEKLQSQVDEIKGKIHGYDKEESQFVIKREVLDKKIRELGANIEKLTAQQKILQKSIDIKSKELKKQTRDASKRGERINTKREPADIQSDFEGRRSFYRQNLEMIKSKDEVKAQLDKHRSKAETMKSQIQCVYGLVSLVEPLIGSQTDHLEKKKMNYLSNLQTYYEMFIKKRGYNGQVKFDVSEEKLLYYIVVDEKSGNKVKECIKPVLDWKRLRDFIRQLSGGECSYATMAYFSALRQIMPSPFFMLDEFEVFMDAGNQKASMDIVIEQIHSLCDAQFFIFTPHEPELKEDVEFIKYFKLFKVQQKSLSNPPSNESQIPSSPETPPPAPPPPRRKRKMVS